MDCYLILSFLQHFYTFQGNALVINKEDFSISVKFSRQLLPYMSITKNGSSFKWDGVYVYITGSLCLLISGFLQSIKDRFGKTWGEQTEYCCILRGFFKRIYRESGLRKVQQLFRYNLLNIKPASCNIIICELFFVWNNWNSWGKDISAFGEAVA